MGFFSRNKSVGASSNMQIPDEFAAAGAGKYGRQDFAGALEDYGTAIDKIHTMCVVADPGTRIRQLGSGDQPILDGFVSALGAALAMNPNLDVDQTVEQAVGYLGQIAAEAGRTSGSEATYRAAVDEISQAYRLGTGRSL